MQTDFLRIDYILTFAAPFHFGTGIREGLVDRTVIHDESGYLYVPGSTIKGTLRERCEQLERFYEGAQGMGSVQSPHVGDAALLELGNVNPSMVTRIFGSQTRAGHLLFDDARQNEDDLAAYDDKSKKGHDWKGRYKRLQVQEYTQVRLNRPTRTAVEGALYTSEYGTHDLAFQGTIQGWLQCTAIETGGEAAQEEQEVRPTYSLLLLLAGLRVLDAMGGNKSSGKGRCSCEIKTLAVNNVGIERSAWEGWFAQLDRLASYGREG